MLRIDRETKKEISVATREALCRITRKIIPKTDGILVSDYGKGLITRELMTDLIGWAKASAKPVIVDPKGLDFTKYTGASLITPNLQEASLAAGIDIVDEASLFAAGTRILETAGIDNLLITCGPEGMVLFEPGRDPYRIHTEARQVFDVSGAGDTVLAVLGLCISGGASLAEGAALANTAAGIVVGKVGTATVSGAELKAAINPDPSFAPGQAPEHFRAAGPDPRTASSRQAHRADQRLLRPAACRPHRAVFSIKIPGGCADRCHRRRRVGPSA